MAVSCCFTGHGTIPEDETESVRTRLQATIDTLHREMGVTIFYVGGCTGFDTLAAKVVFEYRSAHPEVRLIVFVPYRRQPWEWSQEDKAEYNRILAAASEVVCLAEQYYRGCLPRRNRYMVDRSVVCVSYQTKDEGGTASTVKYARDKGLSIYSLVNRD